MDISENAVYPFTRGQRKRIFPQTLTSQVLIYAYLMLIFSVYVLFWRHDVDGA